MRKVPSYKGGGRIKGEPEKPKVNTIDRSKYTKILSNPAPGNDDFTAQSPDAFTPDVLGANGFKYHSGTMGGKDIAYEKNGNVYLYNENPSAGNKFRLTNIGNPSADAEPVNNNLSINTSSSNVAPTIDPNHKPLNLSNPNLSFDPNTNTYKNPVTGSTINPIVEQYNKGGKVRKAPKGYANAGTVRPNPDEGTTNSYVDAIAKLNKQNSAKQEKSNSNAKLGAATSAAGGVAMTLGNQMYTPPQDITTDAKTLQNNQTLNSGIDNTLASSTPWYGLAKGASDIGRSQLKKDKYGNVVGGTNQAADEMFTPSHKSYIDAYQREGVGGVAKDFLLGGQATRAFSDITGNGNKTTGFFGALNKFNGNTAIHRKAADNVSALQKGELDAQNAIDEEAKRRQAFEQNGRLLQSQVSRDDMVSNNVGFANGGKVKGAGTGKSDSINARVMPGSFVVPAKNAPIIEEIKEKVLRKAPKKANLNQKGGTEIRISNGEHLLSPEEKSEIESYGYNVDALAPDSDDNVNLKNGGLTSEKAKIMLKDNQANGKPLTTAQKKYFGWVAGGSKADGGVVGYDKGGKVKTQSEREKIKAEEDALIKAKETRDNQNKSLGINSHTLKRQDYASKRLIEADKNLKSLEKEYKDYNKRISTARSVTNDKATLDKFDNQTRIDKKALLDKIDKANQDRESANQEYKQANFKSTSSADKNVSSTNGLNYMGGSNRNTYAPQNDTSVTDFTPTNTISTGKRAPSRKASTASVSADNLSEIPTSAIPYSAAEESLYGDRTPAEIARMNQVPVLNADTKTNNVTPAGNDVANPNVSPTDNVNNKKNRFDYSNVLGNAINYGIPLAQTAIGLKQLKAAGNRPVDQLDPDYLNSLNQTRAGVTQANDQAKYGFTGAELTALNNQNNNLTNAGRYAARNFSGGSSGNALNMERSVINDSFGRALNTKVSDNALKMDKQQEAFNRQNILNSQIQDKQDRLRTYFSDNLDAWHQKTQSAAGLINSGLSNALDSYRADQRLKNFNEQTKTNP